MSTKLKRIAGPLLAYEILTAFMMVKAVMIGGNFMHLRYERPSLALMVAGGILITSLILFSFISREAHHVARSLSN